VSITKRFVKDRVAFDVNRNSSNVYISCRICAYLVLVLPVKEVSLGIHTKRHSHSDTAVLQHTSRHVTLLYVTLRYVKLRYVKLRFTFSTSFINLLCVTANDFKILYSLLNSLVTAEKSEIFCS
jgi:hypothetical protein